MAINHAQAEPPSYLEDAADALLLAHRLADQDGDTKLKTLIEAALLLVGRRLAAKHQALGTYPEDIA